MTAPKCIAHRGYSEHYKDNSIKGYLKAIEAGADYIEIDIRSSSDGILFCQHDARLKNHTINQTPSTELEKLDILRLDKALQALPPETKILFDIKETDDITFKTLLQIVQNLNIESQIVFGVRSMDTALFFIKNAPQSKVLGFFQRYKNYDAFFKAGGHIARIWENDLTPQRVASIRNHHRDREIWVTACRTTFSKVGKLSKARLEHILTHDIDGIILNDPTLITPPTKTIKPPTPPKPF